MNKRITVFANTYSYSPPCIRDTNRIRHVVYLFQPYLIRIRDSAHISITKDYSPTLSVLREGRVSNVVIKSVMQHLNCPSEGHTEPFYCLDLKFPILYTVLFINRPGHRVTCQPKFNLQATFSSWVAVPQVTIIHHQNIGTEPECGPSLLDVYIMILTCV